MEMKNPFGVLSDGAGLQRFRHCRMAAWPGSISPVRQGEGDSF